MIKKSAQFLCYNVTAYIRIRLFFSCFFTDFVLYFMERIGRHEIFRTGAWADRICFDFLFLSVSFSKGFIAFVNDIHFALRLALFHSRCFPRNGFECCLHRKEYCLFLLRKTLLFLSFLPLSFCTSYCGSLRFFVAGTCLAFDHSGTCRKYRISLFWKSKSFACKRHIHLFSYFAL